MITGEFRIPEAPVALRLLIVSADADESARLAEHTRRLGWPFACASTAEAGLQCFAQQQPDIVIIDAELPGDGAVALARDLHARIGDRWTRMLLLADKERDDDIAAGLAAGCDDVLFKPTSFALIEARSRWLQRSLSAQREASLALKRIRAISDNVLDALVTVDTNETIVACNAACERIFGWKPAEMLGQNLRMLMPEPHRHEHAGHVAAYVHGGPPHVIGIGRESVGLHRDGTVFPIDLAVSEVRVDEQRLFVGIIRDIRARKEAEHKLRENAALLQIYHDEAEAESELARELIERQLQRAGLNDPQLHYWLMPANNFSGDIVAAIRSTRGRRYALLADATGHGLTAAISALPVLSIFYSLAEDDAHLADLVREINSQLCQSMPVGRFVAAALVCIDEAAGSGEIWVGGVPDALLLDSRGEVLQRFPSRHIALGVVDGDASHGEASTFAWHAGVQLLLYSDGLIEACDAQGSAFGDERLLATLAGKAPTARAGAIRKALSRHLAAGHAHDDVSLLLLDSTPQG